MPTRKKKKRATKAHYQKQHCPNQLRSLSPLHDLMVRACPPNEFGRRSVVILADRIGCSYQNLFRAAKRNTISPGMAKRIADLNGGVKFSAFIPFFYGMQKNA